MDGRPEDLRKSEYYLRRELQAERHLTISNTEYQLSDLSITYKAHAHPVPRPTLSFCEN
jgi:hypothetical protein